MEKKTWGSHLHLPKQVQRYKFTKINIIFINSFLRYGPLNVTSAFAFEGMLKFYGSLLHGTRGFGNQIGQHLGAENYLNFEAEFEFQKMNN